MFPEAIGFSHPAFEQVAVVRTFEQSLRDAEHNLGRMGRLQQFNFPYHLQRIAQKGIPGEEQLPDQLLAAQLLIFSKTEGTHKLKVQKKGNVTPPFQLKIIFSICCSCYNRR